METKNKQVYLAGTNNGSSWRSYIKRNIKKGCLFIEDIKAFDINGISECDLFVYVITPKKYTTEEWKEKDKTELSREQDLCAMAQIAEVVSLSHSIPEKILFCYLNIDDADSFEITQTKELQKISSLLYNNGVKTFGTLKDLKLYLENYNQPKPKT